ncbi:OprD family outer membrane porin [Halopseudomonas pelagia]|uniref:Outer membrane porin, OprD family n=1 Tax=Halopseudomonas pelagia TaxID=553151 RepID=A0AA91U3S3_9GAMM|nr:OprD family outer membrane porin [Halopseudomonas pelagia]PCC99913.1 outer membrane porin, OprD family [Halopseudomonas pelagia]QFY56225.1 outer membrane porin, OprD family [Halopseudomonas pelagia]
MKNAIKWSSIALAVAVGNGLLVSNVTAQESEGFIEGSSATLSNRTMNFNRDFRSSGAGQSKRDETATGFVLNFESGYSRGPIGLGFDTISMLGIKLDSTGKTAETGLLPSSYDAATRSGDTGPSNYSEIRGAVKANILNDTVLRYGVHLPENPVIAYDDARLLPNHYSGYSVTNNTIDGLFVEAGRMNDRGEMALSSEDDGAFGVEDEKVVYLGGTYDFSDALGATLYTSKADELWKRHFAGLSYTFDLAEGLSLSTDLAHYETSNESSIAEYDNKATSIGVTLGAGNHGFTLAAQRMGGDAGFAYLDGGIFIANSVQYLDFNAKDEKSYQARYDYDFEGLGIPGLTFMTRYIRGSDIDTGFVSDPAEDVIVSRDTRWERDTNISYTMQAGMLEGVNVLWRNATIRQDAALDGGDVDENRLIVSYTWDLL